jgi:tRNA(Ile)-lysidine synthase
LGLDPVVVLPVTVDRSSGTGLEAAARSARYAALERIAEQAGTSLVLLGHTLDDQAESVLLALARGAGGTALSGMAARRGIFGRPFLDIKRAQTLAICAAEGLTPYSDPTNQVGGPYFSLRSELRGRLIPVLAEVLGPAAIGALARSATRIRQDQECLRQQAAELFNRAVIGQVGPQDDLRLCLDATVLAKAHPALISRALHQAALAAGARPASVNRAQVAAIEALVVDWHGQGPVALPGRIEVRRKCGKLEFHS